MYTIICLHKSAKKKGKKWEDEGNKKENKCLNNYFH